MPTLGLIIMRRSLLFGAALLALASGVVSARAGAPNDEAAFAALNQPAPAVSANAGLIERRAAFTYDNADQAHVAERREDGQTSRESLAISIRNVILLGIAGLVFGLGAAGVKALWILDDTESSSHGWPRWFGL
jgi:hypothetical protein